MLRNGRNLGVLSGLVAENRSLADGGGVSLQGPEHDRVCLTVHISRRLGVGEGLVRDGLLEAVEVLDVSGSVGGRGVTQEGEDGVCDVLGVVELQVGVGDGEDGLVRVLLGHLSLGDGVVQRNLAGSRQASEGEKGHSTLHLGVRANGKGYK